jgi:hypothetical protein
MPFGSVTRRDVITFKHNVAIFLHALQDFLSIVIDGLCRIAMEISSGINAMEERKENFFTSSVMKIDAIDGDDDEFSSSFLCAIA